MSTATPQVSWDNRPVIAKRRRAELYGFLNHLSIPHPVGATKDQMIALLTANNIDINTPHKYFNWSVIQAQDEHGNMHQHIEPVTTPHESARVQAEGGLIDYDAIISERAKATAELEEKTEQLEQQDHTLLALVARLEALEKNLLYEEYDHLHTF